MQFLPASSYGCERLVKYFVVTLKVHMQVLPHAQLMLTHGHIVIKNYSKIANTIGTGFMEESLILRGVEWVHGLFLFPLVLGKRLPHGKLGLFCVVLDNFLQKNVNVLFFGNQISKWRSFEKGLFLTYFSHV